MQARKREIKNMHLIKKAAKPKIKPKNPTLKEPGLEQ